MNVLLINCDKTYSLDPVEYLVKVASDRNIQIEKRYCNVSELRTVSEEVRQRRLLCGVLVVNAYESRLSINEDKAGIGYAVLYRALRDAAQGRAVVVIGGDDRYKDGEQDKSVLSTWAYHKVAAQFDDTYLDGRRGFVFSWDERHNPVHEEALGSYLRAIATGQPGIEEPFKPTPPSNPLPKTEPIRPPSSPTDRTRPGQSGLQQPFTQRVPPRPEKPSTRRQVTTFDSTQTDVHSVTRETEAANFYQQQQEHPGTQGPSHISHPAHKQSDGKTANKFEIDTEICQGEHMGKSDSTVVVYDDPLGAASAQASPKDHVSARYPERGQRLQQQAYVPQYLKALISELLSKRVEPKAVQYLKDKLEKDTQGIKVKIIQIFVDGEENSRYDYPKDGDAFPIPPDIQKRISERKVEDEVLVVAIYEDWPPNGQASSGELKPKFFNWANLIDEVAQHLREKVEKDTKGRVVKIIQIYVDGKPMSKYDYPETEAVFHIPIHMEKMINERKERDKYVVVVICDDGPRKGLKTRELGLKSFNLDELIRQFIDYLDVWRDV